MHDVACDGKASRLLSGSSSLLTCDQKVTVWGVRIEDCLSPSALHGSSSARPSLVTGWTCMTLWFHMCTAYCGLPGKPVPGGFLGQIFSNVTVKSKRWVVLCSKVLKHSAQTHCDLRRGRLPPHSLQPMMRGGQGCAKHWSIPSMQGCPRVWEGSAVPAHSSCMQSAFSKMQPRAVIQNSIK